MEGFTFDTGPTLVTAPHLLDDIWAAAGRRLGDYVELLPLRPFYEVRFRDGGKFTYAPPGSSNLLGGRLDDVSEMMEKEIARFNPADVAGYRRFMAASGELYERAFEQLARRPFLTLASFARVLPELVRSRAQRSVYDFVASYLHHEQLRVVFSFHPLFIGGNPFRASAIYSIVPYLERTGGVWYARGGMHALVQGMERLIVDLGGTVVCGNPVREIVVRAGRVAGVRVESGEEIPAGVVVSNADVANTYTGLVPSAHRRRNSDSRLHRFGYSMSCFILYLGLDRQYPHLRHHTILMPRRYREVVQAIFSGRFLEDDLALYLHMPTRTDPDLAPPGGETMYALVPVPNLKSNLDWPGAGDRLREGVLAILEDELGLEDVRRHIVVERRFTPLDFRDELNSHLGAGFSIEPTLFQSAYFRPHNRSEDVEGLYLVGAGTHPGAGLPGVFLSAEIAAGLIGPASRG